MTNQRPPAVSRNKNNFQTRAIPTMARKKGPSGGVVFLAILVMAGLFVAMLFVLEILTIKPAGVLTPTSTPSEVESKKQTNLLPVVVSAEPTSTDVSTEMPIPTDTPEPTSTPTDLPTATPTPTEKPMPYIVRGTPEAMLSKIFRTESTCDTFYVAGKIVDLQDSPVYLLTVKLGGFYGGDIVDFSEQSGDTTLYGASGFEFAFTNKQIVEDQIYIQLFDKEGEAISSRTYLNVSDSCDQNLLNVIFKQVR